MQFASHEENPRETLRFLSFGALGMLAVIPAVASIFIPHGLRVRWDYVGASLAIIVVSALWLTWKILKGRRSGVAMVTPNSAFLVMASLIISIGLAGAGSGGKAAFYQPLFFLVVVFIACVGDLQMQIYGWLIAFATIWWSSWEEGVRGGTLAVLVIISSAALGSGQAMMGRAVYDLTRRARLRSSINSLLEAASDVSSLEEGLEICVPLVTNILPSNHIVAYFRGSDEQNFSVVTSWPEPDPNDFELAELGHFSEAATTQRAVVDDDHCFIPGGQTLSGDVMLVVDRKRTHHKSMTFMKESSEEIASSFLRLSGRAWYVSGLKSEGQTDPLTALPNRWALEERLLAELSKPSDSPRKLSLAMIDIDRFKEYNDNFGHQTGDSLLEAIAAEMRELVRPGDLVARFGGEEFCVVMPETEISMGLQLMDKLREHTHGPDELPAVTLSIGVAECGPEEDMVGLLQRADEALYSAKKAGRNRVIGAISPEVRSS